MDHVLNTKKTIRTNRRVQAARGRRETSKHALAPASAPPDPDQEMEGLRPLQDQRNAKGGATNETDTEVGEREQTTPQWTVRDDVLREGLPRTPQDRSTQRSEERSRRAGGPETARKTKQYGRATTKDAKIKQPDTWRRYDAVRLYRVTHAPATKGLIQHTIALMGHS